MLRFFEVFAILILAGAAFCAIRSVWLPADSTAFSQVERNTKTVRNNRGTTRHHYRGGMVYFIVRGGK
jgi:hypothetical protein